MEPVSPSMPASRALSRVAVWSAKARRHAAVFHEVAQLAPHIVLRDIRAAGVRCRGRPECRLPDLPSRHGDDAVKDDLAVLLLLIGRVGDAAVKKRIGQRGRERRDLERALLLEERGDRRHPALRRARWSPRRFPAPHAHPRGFRRARRPCMPSACDLSQAAFTSAGCIRSTPGSPTTSASSTPPVIMSLMRSGFSAAIRST